MSVTRLHRPAAAYQIRVVLMGSWPPIWRRVRVSGDASLNRLHRILQVVMGWKDYHLYQFEVCGLLYGDPDPEYEDFEIEMRDARRMKVRQAMGGEQVSSVYI